MKLSTRSRYSTRLMLELALKYNDGLVLLKDISREQDVSLKYLGQLTIPLKAAGLVASTQGAHGGYYLPKSPKDIKLSDIIIAVEGPMDLVDCVSNKNYCKKSDDCITRKIWKELSKRCHDFLNSVSLRDLADYYKKEKNINEIIK